MVVFAGTAGGGPTIMGELSAGPLPSARTAGPAVQPVAPPPTVGSFMVCLQRAKVRSACGLRSAHVGYTEVGETVVVMAAMVNEYGQVRVQFERGWTSVSAGDGTPLLKLLQAAPAARPSGGAPTRIQPGDRCRVLAHSIVRAGCEMDSAELGVLDPGEIIGIVGTGRTQQGKERVRFDRGWTSTDGMIGPLLEVLEADAQPIALAHPPAEPTMNGHAPPSAERPSPRPPAGGVYTCVKKCVIRASADLQSDFLGHLQPGEDVVASETKLNAWGQLRIRFDRGWVSLRAGDGGQLLVEKSTGHELGHKLAQHMPADHYSNPHFGTEDAVGGENELAAAPQPPQVQELRVALETAVAQLPPQSPEKQFATHLANQAAASVAHQEWDRAQSLYARALQKCGMDTPDEKHPTASLDDLVAGAAGEDADNPLFGDDDVYGLIERLDASELVAAPTPVIVRNERQDREDLQSWYDLKALPWGKQLKELTSAGWTEPIPEYDSMDQQIGRRLFVLEHGYGTLVKCVRKKRGWSPCSIDFVEGGKKTLLLRLKGKTMGTPFLISPPDKAPEEATEQVNDLFADEELDGLLDRTAEFESQRSWQRDPDQESRDLARWSSLKAQSWGGQLKALKAEGWEEAPVDYDQVDTQLFRRLFVLEHGFGTLVKFKQTRRGWGPCSIEFVDGGKKNVILRLKGKEMGTPFMLSPATTDLGIGAEDDGAENPLFGDEEVHSVVDRVHANTPRAIYFEPDPERDAADMKIWAVLKSRTWGGQLATLCGKGWVEPEPGYADLESQLARRIFVMEHGFGRVAKVEKTKRGFKPSSIEFVDGGRKSIILRAQGKEMGTPWLISPTLEPISAYQDLLDVHSTPSKKSSSVKTVDPPATPEQDRAD
eukprot:COSAG02_NODE_5321_length_4439_cov_5.402765_2_plen_883_part_01